MMRVTHSFRTCQLTLHQHLCNLVPTVHLLAKSKLLLLLLLRTGCATADCIVLQGQGRQAARCICSGGLLRLLLRLLFGSCVVRLTL